MSISSSCSGLFGHCTSCGSCSIPLDLSGCDCVLDVHLNALLNRKTHVVERHRWCFRKSTRRLEANALLSQKSVLGNDNAGADTRSTGIPLAFSGVGPNTIVSQSGE